MVTKNNELAKKILQHVNNTEMLPNQINGFSSEELSSTIKFLKDNDFITLGSKVISCESTKTNYYELDNAPKVYLVNPSKYADYFSKK